MTFSRFYRRFSAWLALLALALGAMAPAVTQAVVAGSDRAGWVQICSASGMAWVQLDADAGDASDLGSAGHSASNGCTWCTAHAAGGLPPTPWGWAPPVSSIAPRTLAPASAVLAREWTPVQGRAPPALS